MSSSRFAPRNLTTSPKLFGLDGSIEWKEWPDTATLKAAQLQHELVRKINATLQRGQADNLARAARMSRDRLGRVLRGEAPIRLEEMVALGAHLRIEIAWRQIQWKDLDQ